MSKSIAIDDLYDLVQTLSEIECASCEETSRSPFDGRQAAEQFYEQGWRVIDDLPCCPRCVKKISHE